MMNQEIIMWVGVTLLGIMCSALFSGLETGCYGVNVVRLNIVAHRRAGAPARRARTLLRELDKPERLLSTLLIGNNIVNYVGALGVSAILTAMALSDWKIVLVNAAVLTPLLFIFGETLPKDFFRASADRIMPRFAPVLVAVRWILTVTLVLPVVLLMGAALSRLLRGSDAKVALTARARVVALLKEGRRHGVLSDAQAQLFDQAVQLHELRVANVMTPWSRVVFIGADWSRERVNHVAADRTYSHYPVVDRRGRVIGIVRSLDLWLQRNASVTTLMTSALHVEDDTTIVEAMRTLRRTGARHAVVLRRGRPVGFVSERNLIGPLLGKIGGP